MIIEAFLTIANMIIAYGALEAFLITSFITAVVVFAFVLIASRIIKKSTWLTRLLVTVILFAAAWLFELFHYGVQGDLFLFVVPCALVYLLFVTPLSFIYNAVIKKWPVLPAILVQFVACLIGSLMFWAIVIFWFDVFQLSTLGL